MRSLLHDYLATDGNNNLYTKGDKVNLSMNIFVKNPRDKLKVGLPQAKVFTVFTKCLASIQVGRDG